MVWRHVRGAAKDPLAGVDPAAVGPRHRADVAQALDTAGRFTAIVERTPSGPIRDRLDALLPEVRGAVHAVFDAARRTDRKAATLDDLDPDDVTRRLKEARRALARAEDDGRPTDVLRRTAESLDRQLGSVHAVWDAAERARGELHELSLRLGEVVALAGAVASDVPDQARTSLDGVADDLRALRAALDELGGT